tara:strand:- start:1932 stop:2303 length:372 start_codon:yes stop_codon:yes gene_type:complete
MPSMKKENPKVEISFIKGIVEPTIPKIILKRSNEGRAGQALYIFDQPKILLSNQPANIKGMYMIDEEGELFTRNVKIFLDKGKRNFIESIYSWESIVDFHRFIRFAERHAKSYGFGYPEQRDG